MEKEESNLSFRNYLKIYEKDVAPKFKSLEQKRIDLKRKDTIIKIIFFVLMTIAVSLLCAPIASFSASLSMLLSTTEIPAYVYFSCTATGFVIIVVLYTCFDLQKNNQNFKNLLKNKAMKQVLQVFGDIKWTKHDKKKAYTYSYDSSFAELNRSGLFTDFNEEYIDDEFNCTYKGVPFNIYEVKLNKTGANNTYHTVFKGIVISFKCKKRIKNRTVVSTKWNQTRKQNFMISLGITALGSMRIFKHGYSHDKLFIAIILFLVSAFITYRFEKQEEPLNKIVLEDPRFIKKFNVYSSDDTEARYLVSPLFMELLNKFTTAFESNKLKCSFFEDNFMIAITTKKDCFEIGNLNTSLNNPKYIFKFYRELKSIYNMIEYFELDKRF